MSLPLVSIIIPTYKRTDFLKLTLESIQQQTFQDFEVLVIDDGTTDDSNLELCKLFEKVRYFKIQNSGGPSKPRNLGIKHAIGNYIAFVDDDDLWLSNKLEKQVEIFEKNLDFGVVHGCCNVIDENGFLQNRIIGRPGTPEIKHGDVSMRMIGNWTVMMPTSFVRREVIEEVGLFNEEMPPAGEDMEFWSRCSFATKFYYLDEPLVEYRIHPRNISNNLRNYIILPLYLKKVIENQFCKNNITKVQYKLLLNNLCHMQIRTIKINFFQSLKRLFILDCFWFFGKNNFKMMVYLLLFKTNID